MKTEVSMASGYSPASTVERERWELTPMQFGVLLLGRWRVIVASALVGLLLGAVVVLATDRTYTTRASFMPQSGRSLSEFAGLAAQLGVAAAPSSGGFSPAIYAELIRPPIYQAQVLDATYTDSATGRRLSLIEVLDPSGDTPAELRADALEELDSRVQATPNARTGVVQLSVRLEHPVLARAVAQKFLDILSSFNQTVRQSQAGSERRFTERRLAEARSALAAAENDLEAFLSRNRAYQGSPELRLQYERLQRRIMLAQEVHSTLAQSFERAKIEEVRDTPVFTVLEPPQLPLKADSRRAAVKLGMGLFGGLVLGLALAIGLEVRTRLR